MPRFQKLIQLLLIFLLQGCIEPSKSDDISVNTNLYLNTPIKLVNIEAKLVENTNAISILFNVPLIDEQSWGNYIDVVNSDGKRVDAKWRLDKTKQVLFFTALKPNHKYEIIVRPGLKGINDSTVNLKTKKGIISNALDQNVSFSSSGAILPRGVRTELPAKSVGVEDVNISFHRVLKDKQFSAIEYLKHDTWYALRELSSFSEFIYSGRFATGASRNKINNFSIDTSDIAALKEPGIYVAVMRPVGVYGKSESFTYFSVSDIALQTRTYNDSISIFAHSLNTGELLEGVALSVVNSQNKVLKTVSTDLHGMAQLPRAYARHSNLLIAQKENDISLLELASTALDLSEFDVSGEKHAEQKLFLYGPRDLYRPGEMFRVNGVLRDFDGLFIEPQPIKVNIYRPDDSLFDSFVWNGSSQSFYEYSKQIGENEKTGKWRLEANLAGSARFEYNFSVEDFLPERLTLTFGSSKRIFGPNEIVSENIKSQYLYGSPAANNLYQATLKGTVSHSPFEAYSEFHFGVDGESTGYYDAVELSGELDVNGYTSLSFKPDFTEFYSPIIANIKAQVFESGGRPITRYTEQIVLPKESVVGLKTNFEQWVAADKNAEFDIVELNKDMHSMSGGTYVIKVTRDDREYFWDYSGYDGWKYHFKSTKTQVYEQTIEQSDKGLTKLVLPKLNGVHYLEVTSNSTKAKATKEFVAGEEHFNDWSLSNSGRAQHAPDKLDLKWDKRSYLAGEKAKLIFTPSSKGVALVTVESDKLLWKKSVNVSNQETYIELPIDESWNSHDIYASVYFVRPGNPNNFITPKRAFGIAHLPLNRESRVLKLDLDTSHEWQANKNAKITLTLEDPSNSHAIFTLSAVDSGALALSNYQSPDPNAYFFTKSRYQNSLRDNFGDVIEAKAYDKAALRYGAGDTLQRGGTRASSEVRIVELYHGPISFNESGSATVDIKVPDFNGQLKLVAHAFSKNKAAKVEQNVIVKSPLIAELSLPRFIATKDEVMAALDLTNLTGKRNDFDVKITTSGGLNSQAYAETLSIDKEEKVIVQRVLNASKVGSGKVLVTVDLNGETIVKREWKLNIRSHYPQITSFNQKVIKPGEIFELGNVSGLSQSYVSVGTSSNLGLQSHLSFLEGYQYQCLEQTTSKAFPLLNNIESLSKNDTHKLEASVQRLMALQTSSGGFSLWENEGMEEHWLTAFAMDFLTDAKARGVVIPNEVLESGFKRLDTYVNRQWAFWEERNVSNESHYMASYKAYSAYVLAREGKLRLGTLKALINKFSSEVASPLPHAHFAVAAGLLGNVKLMHEQLKLSQTKKRDSNYLGDFGSEIRDTALIAYLLLKHEIAEETAFELSLKLENKVPKEKWLSTQEHVALALAGQQLAARNNKAWSVTFNEETASAIEGVGNETINLKERFENSTKLKNSGKTSIFISQLSSHYANALPEPESHGIAVKRNFYNKSGKKLNIEQLESGDLVVIEILVASNSYRPDTLVVDLLPAGWEIENQNLSTAMSAKAIKIHGRSLSELMEETDIQYQAFRDDRYVAALTTHANQTSRLYYLVRAVTPGKYYMPATYVEDMFAPSNRAIVKVDTPKITVSAK